MSLGAFFLGARLAGGDVRHHLIAARLVGLEFQPAVVGIQHHRPIQTRLGRFHQAAAHGDQARQSPGPGHDGHVGGGASGGQAYPCRRQGAEIDEGGRCQILCDDDGAGGDITEPAALAFAEFQHHLALQITQVGDPPDQDGVTSGPQPIGLGIQRLAPGLARA